MREKIIKIGWWCSADVAQQECNNIKRYTSTFFFWESFNLWRLLLMITFYHQTKISISFWCKRGLNPRFLIQPSETLPVELTGTHITLQLLDVYKYKKLSKILLITLSFFHKMFLKIVHKQMSIVFSLTFHFYICFISILSHFLYD